MNTLFHKIVKGYGDDRLRLYSSSVSFYIAVSALPLMSVLIFIISVISPSLVSELNSVLFGILPRDIFKGMKIVISSIERRQPLSYVPFTVITALWSSTKGVGDLCRGIEELFGTQKEHGAIKKFLKSAVRTLIFYLLSLTSLCGLALIKELYYGKFILLLPIWLRTALFFTVLVLLFSAFFARLGHCTFTSQLPGGVFASLGFFSFSYFYSLYIRFAIENGSLYAELGTAVFFMLWTYFCVNIVFVGAEINKVLSKTADLHVTL